MKFLARIIIIALVVFGIAKYSLVSGISVSSFETALLFSLVLAVLNILVRPILFVLTLPITLLTLGLFRFVLNAVMFLLASKFVSGVAVSGFVAAFLAALLVAVATWIAEKILIR